jgi:hypothetical protein
MEVASVWMVAEKGLQPEGTIIVDKLLCRPRVECKDENEDFGIEAAGFPR